MILMDKIKILVVCILITMLALPALGNPHLVDSTFCDYTAPEFSEWNVSELVDDRAFLVESWSVLNSVNNWTGSSDLTGYWVGENTFAFNGANASTCFSAAFVNNSKYNRSQSLVWTKVTNDSANSDYVFTGVIYAYYNYSNFSMILFGDNEIFLFDYVTGAKSYIRNTLDHNYGAHAGEVIIYDDAKNYWTSNGVETVGPYGAWIKTIYNTYCGSLKSKYWSGTPTLMQEPTSWHTEQESDNMSTDDSVCFGVAFWNPADHGCTSYSVHYDYVNNWRLNYTLNDSATITVDGDDHPRPHMNFPVIDMNTQGDDWWELLMPEEHGGTATNITNATVSESVRSLTNNLSMESRPFCTVPGRGTINNDTIYYYTATLTNFTDWYLAYLATNPGILEMEPDYFSNNYLMIYAQNCEDTHLGSDWITIGIDVDNNRQWDSNDRLIENDATWGGWGGYTITGRFLDGLDTFYSNVFMYCWATDDNAPHNLHRSGSHVHYITLIPLWSLVKSDGEYLNNSDIFGLHISTFNSVHYGHGMCIWENWNETNCSTFFSEDDSTANENRYYNRSTLVSTECWEAVYNCWLFCDWVCWDMCCSVCDARCYDACMPDCMIKCFSQPECEISMSDECFLLWGEGEIPGEPAINSSSGYFDINVSIDSNISVVSDDDTYGGVDVNVSSNVTNSGDETVEGITANITWKNCSCSDWVFTLIDTNVDMANITWHNSSCYTTINIPSLDSGERYSFWITFNITECYHVADDLAICINVSSGSGMGVNDVECTTIEWGTPPSYDDRNGGTRSGDGSGDGNGDSYVDVSDDETGVSLPGARVDVYDEDGRLVDTGYTDEDGRYLTDLEPGRYTVFVTVDGYRAEMQIWYVSSGGGAIAFFMESCLCPPIFVGPYLNLSILGWLVSFVLVLIGFYISYRIRIKKWAEKHLQLILAPAVVLIILGLLCQPILILIAVIGLILQWYYHEKR